MSLILGAGVGASPDMIQDLGLEGGLGMVYTIIIAIDHCILHSHNIILVSCSEILHCHTQIGSYINRKDFALLYAKMFLY